VPDRPFSETQVNTLERFAQLASVAYDNSQLYEQLRANEHKLEQRVRERTRALTRALEENEKLRAQSIQAAAAAERSRLARELHDSVSQAIYGIALGARTMQQLALSQPGRMSEPLNYIVTLADAALAEIRALIFELRPESLEKEGILVALKKQTDALRVRYGLNITVDLCEREPEATLDVKEALYRIALEAMHNTVKHANASQIVLLVEDQPALDTVHLSLTDNGIGFDPDAVGAGHLGLKTMQERVAALNGQFECESAIGAGTTIVVTLRRQARTDARDALREYTIVA
jgi:signal transduction histidine kinase